MNKKRDLIDLKIIVENMKSVKNCIINFQDVFPMIKSINLNGNKNIFFDDIITFCKNQKINYTINEKNKNKLDIYELTDKNIGNNKEALEKLMKYKNKYIKKEYEYVLKRLQKEEVNYKFFEVPTKEELSYLTEIEKKFPKEYFGIMIDMLDNKDENLKKQYLKIFEKEDYLSTFDKDTRIDKNGIEKDIISPGYCLEKHRDRLGRIYLVGPCIVAGYGLKTENTILYKLQKIIDQKLNKKFAVTKLNYNSLGINTLKEIFEEIKINSNDIIIIVDQKVWASAFNESVKIVDEYNNPYRNTMFSDIPIHANKYGIEMIVNQIYEEYLKKLEVFNEKDTINENRHELIDDLNIEEFYELTNNKIIEKFGRNYKNAKVGAIVMNLNPMTKGHLYLVEYARKKVDYLIIFVVKENKSVFSFNERFYLANEVTKEMNNVIVVGSGEAIVSYKTLSIYFEKAKKQEEKIDATYDITIFGKYISPRFNIKNRFVAEEPIDKITRQYNETMKTILPEYGVEVEEISRKKINNKVISASRVRKAILELNPKLLREMLPEVIYNYINDSGLIKFANRIKEYKKENNNLKTVINECKENNIYIYGAAKIAKKMYELLKLNNIEVNAFLVSEKKDNPDILYNKNVIEIDKIKEKSKNIRIVYAINPKYYEEIRNKLNELKLEETLYINYSILFDILNSNI